MLTLTSREDNAVVVCQDIFLFQKSMLCADVDGLVLLFLPRGATSNSSDINIKFHCRMEENNFKRCTFGNDDVT
jgi:hypothetical protein